MGLVEDILVATKEDRVVERRCELARAATDVHRAVATLDPTVDDRPRPHVALGERALPGGVIDREGLARHHDGTADLVCEKLDVLHPALTARVAGGEAGHFAKGTHGFGHFGGELGFFALGHRHHSDTGRQGRTLDEGRHPLEVDLLSGLRRDDRKGLAQLAEREGGIGRRDDEVLCLLDGDGGEDLWVERHLHRGW